MSVSLNSNISVRAFNSLDEAAKREVYQKANESQNVTLVRQLNVLGMRPSMPSVSGPSIISDFMDIATKYDIILSFFKDLRAVNRLLTTREFQSLSSKSWFKKNGVERILGRDFLLEKIKKNNLKRIKVPLKIAVVEEADALTVLGYNYSNNLYLLSSDQITVYAEEVRKEERKLSRDEIDELIQVIAASNFVDLWPANIILAKDGVYFIDTEFKSFSGCVEWGKLGRFTSLVKEEDQKYFQSQIEGKMKEPRSKTTTSKYSLLSNVLSMYEKLSKKEKEQAKDEIEKLKSDLSKLAYVGNKKAGKSWIRPNTFSFQMNEIIYS